MFFLVVERRGNANHFSSRWNHPKTYLALLRKKKSSEIREYKPVAMNC